MPHGLRLAVHLMNGRLEPPFYRRPVLDVAEPESSQEDQKEDRLPIRLFLACGAVGLTGKMALGTHAGIEPKRRHKSSKINASQRLTKPLASYLREDLEFTEGLRPGDAMRTRGKPDSFQQSSAFSFMPSSS